MSDADIICEKFCILMEEFKVLFIVRLQFCMQFFLHLKDFSEIFYTIQSKFLKSARANVNVHEDFGSLSKIIGLQTWKFSFLFTSVYRIYPKYSDTVNVRTPSFFLKRHLFYVPYISGHVSNRVFLLSVNVRTPKTCPLFLIKTSIFHYRNILYICSVYLCFRLG